MFLLFFAKLNVAVKRAGRAPAGAATLVPRLERLRQFGSVSSAFQGLGAVIYELVFVILQSCDEAALQCLCWVL